MRPPQHSRDAGDFMTDQHAPHAQLDQALKPTAPEVDREQFERDGFLVVPSLFSDAEVADMRSRIDETHKEFGPSATDLMSYPLLREIMLDERILGIFKQLLGEGCCYFGWSSYRRAQKRQFNRTFHNDGKGDPSNLRSKNLSDPAKTNYPVLRFGLYLQDHAHHSGGLEVRVGSHHQFMMSTNEIKRLFAREHRLSLRGFPLGQLYNVPSTGRDLVVFNMRTHHSGHFVRPRMCPRLALPAALENTLEKWLPESIFLPVERSRYVIFGTFGIPSQELDCFAKSRTLPKGAASHWRTTTFDSPENVQLLETRGISVNTVALDFFRSKEGMATQSQ